MKKFLKVTIVAILLMIMCTNIVNALSFTAIMTPSSSNVEPSTEFTIRIKVANIDAGQNGINTLSGILDYDENVFEELNESSFEALNGWGSLAYNSETKRITVMKASFVKTEEQVFQVTFKTKSDLEEGTSGQIQFSNIRAANSAEEIGASEVTTTIHIGGEANVENEVETEGNNNVTNNTNTNTGGNRLIIPTNNTVNNTTNNTVNNTNTNRAISGYVNQDNSTNEDIPHTGIEDTLVYLIGAGIIIAIVSYIKFQNINKDIK